MRRCMLTALLLASAGLFSGCGWVAGLEEREEFPPDAAIDAPIEGGTDSFVDEQTPDAAADVEDAGDAPWGSPEVCNLLDDDFDGVVDEGFEWSLGPWQKLTSLSRGESLKTARLTDGTVVVLIAEHPEPSSTRLSMAKILPDGTPSADSPVEVTAARPMSGFGITRTWDDEVGIAYVENDEELCAQACPTRLKQYRDGLQVKSSTVSFDYPEGLVQVKSLLDFTASTANYAFLLEDRDGSAWLNWKDQVFFKYGWRGLIDGIRPNAGSVGLGGAMAWLLGGTTDGEQQTSMIGIVTPGGYNHILIPRELAQTGGGTSITARSGGRAVAWVGSDVYFGITQRSLGASTPRLHRLDSHGTTLGYVPTSPSGELHSVVEFRNGLLTTSTDEQQTGIQRADSSLHLIGKPISFSDSLDHAIVVDGGEPLIVRISEDGTAVWVAKLGCP